MKPFQVLSILLAFTFVCTIPANADNLYASIRGTVTDPTGAVVSGAKLTATNAGTGILYTTTSNSSGAFTFLQLPVGDYTLKAEQTGFKAYQASGIHLDLDQVYNLPVKLTLGAAAEVIVVEANPVQVEQTDMQLGTVVTAATGPNSSNCSPASSERPTDLGETPGHSPETARRHNRTPF
jgi:hypothetical protein